MRHLKIAYRKTETLSDAYVETRTLVGNFAFDRIFWTSVQDPSRPGVVIKIKQTKIGPATATLLNATRKTAARNENQQHKYKNERKKKKVEKQREDMDGKKIEREEKEREVEKQRTCNGSE